MKHQSAQGKKKIKLWKRNKELENQPLVV